jgi:hypothetical protein
MLNIAASVIAFNGDGRAAVIGYCLAFSYVWLSASQLPVDASVMHY